MVEETLRKDYGFNDLRIDELREGAQNGSYLIVFIMDGYDEL